MSSSLRVSGSRRSDQAAVWSDIAAKAARMEAFSDTDAAAAMYERYRSTLDDYLRAFAPVKGQAGAMFAVNGKIVGLDLFDTTVTLASLLRKLVESYAFDALDAKYAPANAPVTDKPQKILDHASNAIVERFPAVGEGEDLRLRGKHLSGGALVKDGRVVHLCVFRVPAGVGNREKPGSRLVRASLRRRSR